MLTRLVRLAALALALAAPCAASAQEPLRLSPLISLTDQAYGKPSAKYQWIYDELRKRKVLEVLRDFLHPCACRARSASWSQSATARRRCPTSPARR